MRAFFVATKSSVSVCLSVYFFRFSFLLRSSRLSRQKNVLCVCSTRQERKQKNTHTHTLDDDDDDDKTLDHTKNRKRALSLCVNTKNNNNATSFIDDARRGI